ncbi:uncharacterized protein LOC133906968 isoform X1 [Phragmites australis]|uniref:uncharacterized protein LOC133906968 isoform X1 n=1 Tax=Phragmites australis TaxID=29695 RepID=UPI002D79B6DC|nr:uncharacterized protein LOC133906968 isoform X1 [Phragmites australis]
MVQEAGGVATGRGGGGGGKPHAVVVAYPLQGHIIPVVHLALRLAARGFAVTFVSTEDVHDQTARALGVDPDGYDVFASARAASAAGELDDVAYELVSDGLPVGFDRSLRHDEFMGALLHEMSAHVEQLLRRVVVDPDTTLLVADTFFVWAATLARKLGIACVSFWTEPALIFNLYYHVDLLAQNGHFRCNGNSACVLPCRLDRDKMIECCSLWSSGGWIPLQASQGHDHVHPRRAGDRAVRAHVVPAGDGHHLRRAPHHLQVVRGGPRRRLHPLQHRGGAGAVDHRRPPRREALLRRGPHLPGGLRAQRRGHLHVGGVGLLPLAGRAACGVRAVHLLRQLRACDEAGAARDRGRRAGQRREIPVGAAAGHRELRRPGPSAGGVFGGRGGAWDCGAVVLPGGGAHPRRRGRVPDALRLELHPGERVGGRAHAVLPAAHRPAHQPASRRAGVGRRRVRRGPRRGARRRGEGADRGRDGRRGGREAPGAGEEAEGHARGRRGARRLVAAQLRRICRRAEAPVRRPLSRPAYPAGARDTFLDVRCVSTCCRL